MSSPSTEPTAAGLCRLDRWLWTVRIFRTRALATAACRSGRVMVNAAVAKPARNLQVGDAVQVNEGVIERVLRVRSFPPARVGAPKVAEYCEELTSPEAWARAREQRVQHLLAGARDGGRPTKRDRRRREQFLSS